MLTTYTFIQPTSPPPTPHQEPSEGDKEKYGKLVLKTTFPKSHRLKILFYWGSFEDWKTIYNSKYSKLTCGDRDLMANFDAPLWYNTTLDPLQIPDDPALKDTHYTKVLTQYFFSKSPYYFFIALSNCDTDNDRNLASSNVMYTQGSVDVKVDFLMTNGNTLDSRHFSADEIGVFGTAIAFFVIQVR